MDIRETVDHPEHVSDGISSGNTLLSSLGSTDMYDATTESYDPNSFSQAETGDQSTEITRTTTKSLPEYRDHWEAPGIFGLIDHASLSDVNVKSECLRMFWKYQLEEVQAMSLPRVQSLPPKRIRRIIKYDEDVQVRTGSNLEEIIKRRRGEGGFEPKSAKR